MKTSKSSGNKIDLTTIDLEKGRDMITNFPGLIQFAHSVGSALIKPEDKGRIKGNALAAMHDQTDRQFHQIYDQMQTLINQANLLKERVTISERIYQADIGFTPVINKIYYLYKRKNEVDVLSMVGPKDWGKKMPFEDYIAEVRLMSDHTWEVI